MHRLSRRSAVSCLLRHRATAVAAQASVLSPVYTVTRDVNIKWYSVASGSVNEAPPKEKDDTVLFLLGKLYESAVVKEPTPSILFRDPKELHQVYDYNEFYQKTFNEDREPLKSCHFTEYLVNRELQFRCILYIPTVYKGGVFDEVTPGTTKNVRLYVKGVLFSDDFGAQLLPSYLSFVKGVVDCNCFPLDVPILDVSNQNLQENCIVSLLRKWLLRNTFVMIRQLHNPEYRCFWKKYGTIMKSGIIEDRRNHSILAPLLQFYSADSERGMISLDSYVENMRCDQKSIYYIVSIWGGAAIYLPIVRRFTKKGVEVLLVSDPLDKAIIRKMESYKEKNFVDISKEKKRED